MLYKSAISFLLLSLAHLVVCVPQGRAASQCGPGLYDPTCPSTDHCCYFEGLGNRQVYPFSRWSRVHLQKVIR
ncbi:hypothetical protein C8R45DRAFT_1096225 [Mycena sanguinolenta]|nr:hypothetical protein C8R45DRAFT_1096225 [Mycena sanguinolenta]